MRKHIYMDPKVPIPMHVRENIPQLWLWLWCLAQKAETARAGAPLNPPDDSSRNAANDDGEDDDVDVEDDDDDDDDDNGD